MQMLYVTEAVSVSLRSCRSITIFPNTLISLKTILSIFFSANSRFVSVISIKKSGCPLRTTTIVRKNILTCSKRTMRKSSVRSFRQGQRIFSIYEPLYGAVLRFWTVLFTGYTMITAKFAEKTCAYACEDGF